MNRQLLQIEMHTITPIESNGAHTYNCSSISLYNAGDSTVILDRHFTIPPKGTLQLGVNNEHDSILTVKVNVIFSGGTTNRLEGIILVPLGKRFANYVQQ